MIKLAIVLAAASLAAPAAADPPALAATPVSVESLASDPRMIAALRHANAVADRKCGDAIAGTVDLATKAEAMKCRRRIIATAKLDAEGEITGH